MKNYPIILTILCLSSINCLSQNKGYFAISLGPSIPIGEFASKDANNDAAGFAKTGAIFDISFAYKLGKNFGLSGLLRGQSNRIDDNALESELTKQIGGSWTVDSEPWTIGGLMFGGYGSFPITPKVSFETKAMIGFISATCAEYRVTLDGSGGATWVQQSSEFGSSFAYLFATGFKFDVSKRICLIANVDYLTAKPEFRDVVLTSSTGATQKNTFSQNFSTINFGFGVGLRL